MTTVSQHLSLMFHLKAGVHWRDQYWASGAVAWIIFDLPQIISQMLSSTHALCYDLNFSVLFWSLFLFISYFHYLSDPVFCYYFSFPDSVSHYALVFPSHFCVFLCYLNLSTPESVSSHSSVLSGLLAFSEFFLRSSFSPFLIYIVINSPVPCSS